MSSSDTTAVVSFTSPYGNQQRSARNVPSLDKVLVPEADTGGTTAGTGWKPALLALDWRPDSGLNPPLHLCLSSVYWMMSRPRSFSHTINSKRVVYKTLK